REVMRVGGVSARPIDVRFIAATNRDLEREVVAGRFRQDLLYRLNGVSIAIPPLRERLSEIPDLAREFLERASREAGRSIGLAPAAVAALQRYSWPGNV